MRPSFFTPSSSAWIVALFVLGSACGDSGTTPEGGAGGGGGSPNTGAGTNDGASAPDGGNTTTTNPDGGNGAGGMTTTDGGSTPVDPWTPLVSLKELDLGTFEIGHAETFALPDRMIGLTTLSESTPGIGIGVASLRSPMLGSVVSNFSIPGLDFGAFVDDRGALTAGNPQSDLPQAFPVPEGNWLLRLAADEGLDSARSRVFVRRTNDGDYHGGALDIHVYIAGGSGADSSLITTVLNNLFNDYYTPGLSLAKGNITFDTISSDYAVVSTQAEYSQMLTSSTNQSAPAVNLFVIGDFSGEMGNALGVAGGIPGSPMVHGTSRSGVAYTPTGDEAYDASILAHEIGHLGGLFHTTEFQVEGIFDPLGDTAQCPNINNMNPQNCPDVNNVMFPIAYGGFQFSQWQVRVIAGSALYRGILDNGGSPSAPLLPANPTAHAVHQDAYQLPHQHAPQGLTGLRAVLHGHWCGSSGDVASTVFARLVPEDLEVLWSIATDGSAFDVARGRALDLLLRTAQTTGEEEDVITLARDILGSPTSGRRARLASIDILEQLSPVELSLAGQSTPALEDPVVVARFQSLGY